MERYDRKRLSFEVGNEIQELFGINDENLRLIEDCLQVQLLLREGVLTVSGPSAAVERAGQSISNLTSLIREGKPLGPRDIKMALRLSGVGGKATFRQLFSEVIE